MVWRVGDRARLSDEGVAKVRSMPEAWGLHRALSEGLSGEVTEVESDGGAVSLSVDFGLGSAHYWPADCFVPANSPALTE